MGSQRKSNSSSSKASQGLPSCKVDVSSHPRMYDVHESPKVRDTAMDDFSMPRSLSSRLEVDSRTYNDPMHVHQWRVSSATGSQFPLDGHHAGLSDRGFYNDTENGFRNAVRGMDGFSSHRYPAISHVALPCSSRIDYQTEGLSNACTTSAEETRIAGHDTFLPGPDYDAGECLVGDDNQYTTWCTDGLQYNMPAAVDMTYTTSEDMHPETHISYDDLSLALQWKSSQYQGHGNFSEKPVSFGSSTMTWSPVSPLAMEPSISSSYSQNSFRPPVTGSPKSSTGYEDTLPNEMPYGPEHGYDLMGGLDHQQVLPTVEAYEASTEHRFDFDIRWTSS